MVSYMKEVIHEDPDFLILIKRTHSFDFDIWVLIMSFKTIFPLYRGR